MKHRPIISLVALIIIFFGCNGYVVAQQSQWCASNTVVTSGNYPDCCPMSGGNPSLQQQCSAFKLQTCTASPQDPICRSQTAAPNPAITPPVRGQIQGGTILTTPVNNTGDSTAGVTSRSGSDALSSCSAIRFQSLLDILIWLKCIIGAAIIPLIFAAAFVFFLWGVLRFMMANTADKKKDSQKLIWWGLIGLFVMVSVWGIIKIASVTLGIDSTAIPLLKTEYLK